MEMMTHTVETTIVSRPVINVVGLLYHGKNEHNEIPRLWEQLMPGNGAIKHTVQPPVYYGVMGNYDETTGEFDYMAGQGVEQVADLAQGMASWVIPAQVYAVFPCTLATIRSTFQYAYESWLPQSGFERGQGPEFEYYDEHFNGDDSPIALYIPIKPAI